MNQIVIVAPPYVHSSHGICAMHYLCHTINMLGGRARLLFHLCDQIRVGSTEHTNKKWNTPALDVSFTPHASDIIIYPETLSGNPLGAKNVVRWMGHKDGALGVLMKEKASDFIIAYSKIVHPKPDCVLFYANFNECFYEGHHSGMTLASYFGKSYLYGKDEPIPGTLVIERDWPETQEKLADLLRRTKILYTYDTWSATNIEAIICGAYVNYMRWDIFTPAEIDGTELGSIPRLDRDQRPDFPKYDVQRAAMMVRISELRASWNARVCGLMAQLNQRFGDAP